MHVAAAAAEDDAGNDYADSYDYSAGGDDYTDSYDYSDYGNDCSDDDGAEATDDYSDGDDADQVPDRYCSRVLTYEAARLLDNSSSSDSDEYYEKFRCVSQFTNLTQDYNSFTSNSDNLEDESNNSSNLTRSDNSVDLVQDYNDCISNSNNLEDESDSSYLTRSDNSVDLVNDSASNHGDEIDQPQVHEIPRNNDFVIRIESSSSSSSDNDSNVGNEFPEQDIEEEQPELNYQRYKIF